MNKFMIFTALSLFVAARALAFEPIEQINVSSNPRRPVVILTDLKMDDSNNVIYAPWISLQFTLSNDTKYDYYVNSVIINVKGAQGEYVVSMPIWDMAPLIEPGKSATTRQLFVGGLPRMESTVYSVEATFIGYGGAETKPIETTTLITTQ